MDHDKPRQNAREVVKRLIAEDGWKGFYRGLGPRFLSMSMWGTTMIVSYEYLSKNILLLPFFFVHIYACIAHNFQVYQIIYFMIFSQSY